MKKTIKNFVVAALLGIGILSPFALTQSASAVNAIQGACSNGGAAAFCDTNPGNSVPSVIQIVINVLLFIVGIVSVIMIIISGFRFITSGGNSGSVTSAKNTLLYSVIGLVVAFFAYAIVNWVLDVF